MLFLTANYARNPFRSRDSCTFSHCSHSYQCNHLDKVGIGHDYSESHIGGILRAQRQVFGIKEDEERGLKTYVHGEEGQEEAVLEEEQLCLIVS